MARIEGNNTVNQSFKSLSQLAFENRSSKENLTNFVNFEFQKRKWNRKVRKSVFSKSSF